MLSELSEVTAHRRFLHQIPELDDQLPQTLALVNGVLRGHRCQTFSPMDGCVCVWFDYGKAETAAFRADMDALALREETGAPYSSRHPGRMHACGHDGHTAIALCLAQWLSEGHKGLARNVLIIFQPSEESTGGADRLCRTGILDDYHVTRIFGLQLWPGLPEGRIYSRPGALMARSNEITVRITGKSVPLAHWEEGQDALVAGVRFVQQAYELAEAVPPPCVLRFGKLSSGNVRDAVSGETELSGNLRTYAKETYGDCVDGLKRIAVRVSKETGCQVGIHLSTGYPAVWNHEALFAAVREGLQGPAAMEGCPEGAEASRIVHIMEKPVLMAEDFAFYQRRVPGVFFFLGAGETPELRSPRFNFNDEAVLPRGVEFLKRLARLP